MAIIRKPLLPLKGRYGPVVFYRLPCGLICRALTPHTRKRILKDPKFAEFRKCSKRMAKASKIGSAVYKALPEDFRQFWMYRAFVGEALKMLKDQEMTGEQVLESLFRTYAEVWYIKAETKKTEQITADFRPTSTKRRNTASVNIRWKESPRLSQIENTMQTGKWDNSATCILFRNMGMGPPMSMVKKTQ